MSRALGLALTKKNKTGFKESVLLLVFSLLVFFLLVCFV